MPVRTALAASPTTRTTRRAMGAVVALAVVAQLVALACIRLTAVNSVGGDLCQDVAALHRILRGQNPYGRLTECGILAYSPHPPVSLLVMAPFAWLPAGLAGLLWDVVGLGMLALALALIARELRLTLRPEYLALLLGLLIVWPPLLDTLLEAQMSPALLLLLTLVWLWRRQDLPELAGAALGVAAAIRLFPALAALYFLLRRDWRTLYGMAASFAAASALALPLVGPQGYLSFIGRALPSASAIWASSPHNVSLWGLAHHIAPGGMAGDVGLLLALTLLASLVYRTWRARGLPIVADETTFLLYYPAMLLVSPLGWQYYFLILLLPIIVIARDCGWLGRPLAPSLSRRSMSAPRGLLVAFLALLWLYHLPFVAAALGDKSAPFLALPTIALLALAGALLRLPTFVARERDL